VTTGRARAAPKGRADTVPGRGAGAASGPPMAGEGAPPPEGECLPPEGEGLAQEGEDLPREREGAPPEGDDLPSERQGLENPPPEADDLPPEDGGVTADRFLGGRFVALQPARGHHRSGADAILLAAAVPATAAGRVVDFGAGVGVAGMAVAVRCPATTVTLVEIDPALAALAVAALALPENAGLAGRVAVVTADVTAPAAARARAGLPRGTAETVILNPPFHVPGRVRASPAEGRAGAHVLGPGGLDPWLRTAADLLVPGGRVAVIFPAEGLADLLAALAGRFGAVTVLPVHPRAGAPAVRVVVRAVKGRRGGLALLDRLVLHEPGANTPTPDAAAILRDGAPLPPG